MLSRPPPLPALLQRLVLALVPVPVLELVLGRWLVQVRGCCRLLVTRVTWCL